VCIYLGRIQLVFIEVLIHHIIVTLPISHLHLHLPTGLLTFMELPEKLLFAIFLILSVAIDGTKADTMLTGTVICDQCKDGQRSLFDYPVNGEI